MANLLKNMKLVSVDLVRRGANQEAHISLYKGMDADPEAEPHAEAPVTPGTINKADGDRFDHIEEFP